MKQLLKKADCDQTDPYIAVLNYRTTPLEGIGLSPAQILFGRSVRNRMPLQPEMTTTMNVRAKMTEKKEKQKFYYDQGTKELTKLRPGEKVIARKNNRWEPTTVKEHAKTPRSYLLDGKFGVIRRNRVQIKPVSEGEMRTNFKLLKQRNEEKENLVEENTYSDEYRTRYGRIVKAPSRYPSSII